VSSNRNRYPEEVVINDESLAAASDASSTPAGEAGDDFFSSWDKPTIKRPSNPPSRSGTPPVVSRTASPFLSAGNANGSSTSRPKSPLAAAANDAENALPAPTAIRSTSASAIRKGPSALGGGAKRTNILGAKKTQKLGAKKVTEDIDFEAAEKAAKAEAERIEKLGYDPEAEQAETKNKSTTFGATATKDTPAPVVSPKAGGGYGSGSTAAHARSPSEVERLGMGVARLGFGQTGMKAAASTAPAPRKLGFGSVGKADDGKQPYWFISTSTDLLAAESEQFARQKFGTQKGISSDEFFGRNAFDPSAQAEAKTRLQGFEGATSISSNAYFGRPEDDLAALGGGGGEYGDIETVAKDFVRRMGLTAGDDLENLINVAGEGGRKLRGAVARYLNS
jgi:ADP-ribosylation factor GTPase-activating protein 2/3